MTRIKVDLAAAMRRGATAATGTLQVLANEDRLLLLCALCGGEACVSELEDRLAIRQPTLSQQLGVLRRRGLVHTRRAGRQIYYSIADDRVRTLLGSLHALYCP
ncbi:MAG TPA: metalloregulator ArsR/SmtB family transcription factor [Casimicrobiaceae bacterium]